MSQTLLLLDNTDKAANTKLTVSKLKRMLLTNEAALRLLAYGETHLHPTKLQGHDHGARRGVLLDEHYHASTQGPYRRSGYSGGHDGGTPLYANQSGFDFADFPKLVLSKICHIPGGAASVTVRCLVYGQDSGADYALRAEFRHLGQIGYPSGYSDAFADLTQSVNDGEVKVFPISVDLFSLGDVSADRDLELFVWLFADPGAGFARLLNTVVIPDEDPLSRSPGGEYNEGAGQLLDVDVSQLLSGVMITAELASAWHQIVRQEVWYSMGHLPGVFTPWSLANQSEVWEEVVTYPHQHQGRKCLTDQGTFFVDGPVRVVEGFSASFLSDAGDDTSFLMNTAPYKGALLHGNGDVISQATFTHRMSIPSGARAFNIFAAIDFENSEPVTRLWVCAWLRPLAVPYTSVAANNLITSIQSLGVYGTQVRGHPDTIGRQSFYSLPVDPVQSAYYVANSPRKQSGLGLWTLDASKGDLQLRTAGLDSQRGKYRTCQPIVVTTEHLLTGDYIWAFKFLLQLGDTQSVVFDEEATLQWLSVRPRPGF